jgi:uncharacterized membrane protein
MDTQDRNSSDRSASSDPRRMAALLICLVMGLYAAVWSVVSILRHEGLHTTGLDLGMQHQVLWNTGRGRFFETSIQTQSYLAQHLSLIGLFIAPLTWLPGNGAWWLLIFQSTVLASAAWPLYQVAKRELNDNVWSVVVPVMFLVYPVLGFINRFDFHMFTLAVPLLLWTILLVSLQRLKAATIVAILSILCREEVGVAVAGIGVYSMFDRRTRAWGPVMAIFGLAWSMAAIAWIIPGFLGDAPHPTPYYRWLGESPGEMLWSCLSEPSKVASHVFGDSTRVYTLLFLLWPLALLPLLAPGRLACAAVPLLIYLLADHASVNSIYYQYLCPVLPLVWWAAIGGAARLSGWTKRLSFNSRGNLIPPTILAVCCVVSFAVENPITKPLDDPYWRVDVLPGRRNSAEFREARKLIGSQESVLATMALAPHFCERRSVGFLGWPHFVGEPDHIILDISDFRWRKYLAGGDYVTNLDRVLQREGYGVRYDKNDIVLLSRSRTDDFDRASIRRRFFENARRECPELQQEMRPPT